MSELIAEMRAKLVENLPMTLTAAELREVVAVLDPPVVETVSEDAKEEVKMPVKKGKGKQ